MTTNYIKLSNNLESLKLFTIKENLPNYIDMINSGEKSTVDALYELTEKEMDLKEKRAIKANVIKLRDDEPSGYYCLDGIFYLKARRKL